ncbi:MAG: hypothetical protein RLZZ15_1362 [Verrucomicrobiota bacterium]|jgi:hypothetical protein
MRAHVLCLLATVVLSACASHPKREEAKSSLLFSVLMVDNALSGKPNEAFGCHFEMDGDGLIVAKRTRPGGKIHLTKYSSDESLALHEAIRAIGFQSFNYGEEVDRADTLRWEKGRRDGGALGLHTFDGAEYEIRFQLGAEKHTMRMWNPRQDLSLYAPHSAKIAKLKAVLNLFALHCKRAGFIF